MSNIFRAIGHFFSSIAELLTTPRGRQRLADDLVVIQKHIPAAINVVQEIDRALGGNKTAKDVLTLAHEYEVSVPWELHSDPVLIDRTLSYIAFKSLKGLIPEAPDGVLNAAIELAVRVVKVARVGEQAGHLVGQPSSGA